MSTLLVRNADWLVTMDPQRRIIRDGAVAIQDNRIVQVGKTSEIARSFTADATVDAAGKMVLPGLIDTHVHNTQQCGRGLADECDIPKHLLQRLYGYEKELTSEDAYWAALACQLEMIRTCTTRPSVHSPSRCFARRPRLPSPRARIS